MNHLIFRLHFRIALTLPIGLTNLTTLEIFDNTLTSLVLPADLKNLEFLNIQNNQLPALTLLNGLPRLKILDISHVGSGCARRSGMLQSLTLPEGMHQLRRLYLNGNPINQVAAPQGMNIDNLRVYGFSKADIAFYDLETRASKTLSIIPLEEGGLQISWGGGSLQSSADLSGNWEDVEGESPLPIEEAGASRFLRLRP